MNKQIKIIRKTGLWLDHAEAKFIEADKDASSIRTVHSSASGLERIPGESPGGTQLGKFRSTNNEAHKHRKEENIEHEYFEYLSNQLQAYDEIFLFGPTTAAHELFNYILKENPSLAIKIQVGKSDYLTDPQLFKMVKEHFATHAKKTV